MRVEASEVWLGYLDDNGKFNSDFKGDGHRLRADYKIINRMVEVRNDKDYDKLLQEEQKRDET